MKFTLSILALLAIAFLVGCSAKDTGNDIGKAELTELSKKYSGTYVFSRKFESEIKQRENMRDTVNRQILDEVSRISDKDERNKMMRKLLKERYYNNPKIAQTLSNGKKYYTTYIDYERASKKILPNISSFYEDKIKRITGEEAYKYASVLPLYLYIDDNDEPVYISMSVSYSYKTKKYGFFGDEGRGFSLSRDEIRYTKGGNKFYIEDLEKR